MRTDLEPARPSPTPLTYVVAYTWWFIFACVSVVIMLAARDLYQMALVLSSWDRYVVHAINQFLTVFLAFPVVIAVIVLESYFRNGANRGILAARVWRAASVFLAAMAVIHGLRLVIEVTLGGVNLVTLLLFAASVLGSWGSRRQAQRLEGSAPPPLVFVEAGKFTQLGWLALALLFVGGAVTLFLPIKYPLNPYDEGLALVNGLRVGYGDIPFRDYWAIYPPGQSYVLAALFGLLQPTIMVERVYDTLARLGIAVVIFWLGFLMLPWRRWVVVPYLGAATLLAAATFYGYAVFPALLCAFIGLLLGFLHWRKGGGVWLFGAALATGLCLLFRIDIGLYCGFALAIGVLAAELWVEPAPRNLGQRLGRAAIGWLIVAAGAALVALPFYGLLAARAGVDVLWDNLIVFPATIFHEVRHLPYPPLWADWSDWGRVGDWLRFYLPIVTLTATGLVVLLAGLRSSSRPGRLRCDHAQAIVVAVFCAGLFVQALSRYDEIHVLPASLCTILLLVWLAQQVDPRQWRRPGFVAGAVLVFTLPLWFYFLGPFGQLSDNVARFGPLGCYSERPAASCVPINPDQETILRLLDQLDPEGGPVYSGLLRHDQIFVNDVSLYFLARRPISTRYHELHPGVATTLSVQEEIVGELEAGAVEWLVLVDWPNPREPNASALSSDVVVLDEYIRSNFQRMRSAGWYQLWQRVE